jgi:dolichyl-diphosphooligosaccharide--protein glycosyltransferase
MSDERGPDALLEDRPELEAALESVLAVDDAADGWTFDDIDIDSGEFGELVSRGVVEKDGNGEYRVADPAAVRAALGGETTEASGTEGFDLSLSLPDVEPRDIGLLAAALAAVAFARAYVIGSVYRGGDIVLSGNDPYYYRYWVEQVNAETGGAVDFGSLTVLPDSILISEPLMVAALWWLAELLGGTAQSIGHVLAWYPVASAVVSAVFVYLLAVRTTGDQRVGLASVLFLGIIPGHALRTSLGYADHHAFDYPWLGLTALALVVIATTAQDRASLRAVIPWAGGALLGAGVAGQVLAWDAGPLLVVPVGFIVLGKTLLDVDAGRSPLVVNLPVLAGTGLAAGVVWTIHTLWGWHTGLVASTPALLFAGVVGVVATAEMATRLGATSRQLAGIDAAGFVLAIVVGRTVFTEQWNEAFARTDALFRSDAIAETYGLFNPGTLGFLLLFGFALVLALPAMVWGVKRAVDGRADWLVLGVYGWYFLVLAGIQVRFVGELATFAAVFAGYAFVWIAVRVEVARPLVPGQETVRTHIPEPRTLALVGLLFLLFGSLGFVQVPVKTGQVTVSDGQYQTAVAIEADADARGLEYPENYVLSIWGDARMYNYFVNGESSGYGYAQSTYAEFLNGVDGDEWYERMRGRVGYVVTTDQTGAGPQTMQTRLHEGYASRTGQTTGLGHYQAVFESESGSHRAFALVPGATVTGTAAPNATVTATTTASIPNAEFEYTRRTQAAANGSYELTLANPGNYTVETGNETGTVTVNETAVRNGTTIPV